MFHFEDVVSFCNAQKRKPSVWRRPERCSSNGYQVIRARHDRSGLAVLGEIRVTRHTAYFTAAVSLGTAAVCCAAAVWLTNDIRAFGLGIIPAAVLATALVWYFEMEDRSAPPILSDRSGHSGVSEPDASARMAARALARWEGEGGRVSRPRS